MKTIIYSLFLQLFLLPQLTGQQTPKDSFFILSGQLKNCPESNLLIFYKTKSGNIIPDTIHLEPDGRFYLKTPKVKEPCVASIQEKTIQINNFFVAPGYDLTITGDAANYVSLFKSKKISGFGATSNQYRIKLDAAIAGRADSTLWFELDDRSLLVYVNRQKKLQDSVAKIVFNNKPRKDHYLKYFETMVRYDSYFQRMYMLLAHVNINNYDRKKSNAYINNNIDPKIFKDLYNDKYMVSPYYREFIMINEWPAFLANTDRNSAVAENKNLKYLEIIKDIYPDGLVKDFALYTLISRSIYNSKSFAAFNESRERLKPFISAIQTRYYITDIDSQIISKEEDLVKTQVGKPAPAFTLRSSDGQICRLEDFKGKVVYLDLWASWCMPCRAEIPSLRALTQKFKNDDRIVFIGVAVNDGYQEWKTALEKDQPTWLQLIDSDNDIVWNSYAATAIPRYVIIDKNGNIANFDAPNPGDKEKIEKLLLDEAIR